MQNSILFLYATNKNIVFKNPIPNSNSNIKYIETVIMKNVSEYYRVGQKSPYDFFHKIEDTFFIFTNNFIDLDILSMSAISCIV